MSGVHRQRAMDPEEPLFVIEEGQINLNYRLGLLAVTVAEEEQSLQVILVAKFNGKNLVAVPSTAWHKKTIKRILPTGSFAKPTAIEVCAVNPSAMEEPYEELKLKVWVGFLSDEVFDAIDMSQTEFEADHTFDSSSDEGLLPYAKSLVEVANDVFAFFSAGEEVLEEDAAEELPNGADGSAALPARMDRLEDMLMKVTESLESLSGQTLVQRPRAPRVTFASQASTLPRSSASGAAAKSPVPGSVRKPALRTPSLDPGLMQAAQQAGLKSETVEEVARLLAKQPKHAATPDIRTGLTPDPLSDLEEEGYEQPPDGSDGHGLAGSSADPLQQAVMQLTGIMQVLTEDRKKKGLSKLENALEYTSSASAESGVVGTGKRSAAARRALRSMLNEHPEELSAMVERLMMEDLTSQTLPPGMAVPAVTARAWVEHRSRIGTYRTLAHAAWGVAGALDAITRGQHQAARARLNILLLQLDQSACDKGNWMLASELALENPPPFTSLMQHAPPTEGEPPYSKLLDARRGEIALAHLREQEDFQSKRRALGKPKKDDVEDEKDSPKRRAKAKAKAKASSEGDA